MLDVCSSLDNNKTMYVRQLWSQINKVESVNIIVDGVRNRAISTNSAKEDMK